MNSGFGAFYNQSVEGEGQLRWDSYGVNYAFIANLDPGGYSPKGTPTDFRLGVSLSYNQRRLDYENLVFTGQLDPLFGIVSAQNIPISTTRNSNVYYVSAAMGASFRHYSKAQDIGFRVGLAAHHINKPRNSLLGNDDLRLPWRWTAHGSVQLEQFNRVTLIPAFKVDWQNASTISGVFSPDPDSYTYWSVNYGAMLATTPRNKQDVGMYGGVWFKSRRPFPNLENTNSMTAFLGIIVKQRLSNYNIGLSYDFDLGGVGLGAGGAYEISLIFNLPEASPCGTSVCHPYSKYPRPLYF